MKVIECQNAEVVGTALKSISLRLRSSSTDLEKLGEDSSGAAGSLSLLRDKLLEITDQKVDIMLDED